MTTNNQQIPSVTQGQQFPFPNVDMNHFYGSKDALPTFGTEGYIPKKTYALSIFRKIDNLVGKAISKLSKTMNEVDDSIASNPLARKLFSIPVHTGDVTYMLDKRVVEYTVAKSLARQRELTLCKKDLENGQKLKVELTTAKLAKLEEAISKLEAKHKKLASV